MKRQYYRHYKGGKYILLNVGTNSETLEKEVVYKALYGDYSVWVRPYDMFFESVNIDGQKIPRFKEISEEEALFEEDELQYLRKKHSGGVSNAKGNDYELFYIVKEVMTLLVKYCSDLSSVYIIPQIEFSYVDDLFEYVKDSTTYCQLKNQKNITWGDGSANSLFDDFYKQGEICQKREERFKLR